MQVQSIDRMFNFKFKKPSHEIIAKAKTKVAAIRAKIEERVIRIRNMREEHNITDAVLNDIHLQIREQTQKGLAAFYNSTVKGRDGVTDETVTVGAGVVTFLMSEGDFMSGERAQVERLELIIRNLADLVCHNNIGVTYVEGHNLDTDELKFLGF